MGNKAKGAYEEQQANDPKLNNMKNAIQNIGNRAKIKEQQLNYLVKNRQAAINPYENITNEFANLPVATKASEFEAEQADIALANTLDTMAATGQSAGGATALAQAALRSKKGISAKLEQQEVSNARAAAQGADNVQKLKAEGEKFRLKLYLKEPDSASRKIETLGVGIAPGVSKANILLAESRNKADSSLFVR